MTNETKIIFISDITGRPGRKVVKKYLGGLFSDIERKECFVIANVENASGGFGLSKKNYNDLSEYGIDCMTSGNHIWDKREILDYIDEAEKLIRPMNYPKGTKGVGYRIFEHNNVKIGVINLLGQVFMSPIRFYWEEVEEVIREIKKITPIIVIDFHAEATAEKICFSHWASERGVSAVLGTHTHVQTADEKIINNRTATLTDVGFCGAYESIIGMEYETSLKRFTTCIPERFNVEMQGLAQFNAVEIFVDNESGRATNIKRINVLEDISEVN